MTNDKEPTTTDYEVVSISVLGQREGFNLSSDLPARVKQAKAGLPAPEIHGHRKSKAKTGRPRSSTWIVG